MAKPGVGCAGPLGRSGSPYASDAASCWGNQVGSRLGLPDPLHYRAATSAWSAARLVVRPVAQPVNFRRVMPLPHDSAAASLSGKERSAPGLPSDMWLVNGHRRRKGGNTYGGRRECVHRWGQR